MVNLDLYKRWAIRREGLKNTVYIDTVGVPTIGIGHNLHTPISEKAIYQIFTDDVNEKIAELDAHLPWWKTLDDIRQLVILDMAFNLGVEGLLAFHTTLAHIQAGEYEAASVSMLESKWATQVKGRAVRLAEAMKTGVLPL